VAPSEYKTREHGAGASTERGDPGVAVTLPNGQTISDPKSPTGKPMSPVADLTGVAAAGRQASAM